MVVALSVAGYAVFHQTSALLPFSAWQVIFFPAIVIGYHLPEIEKRVMSWSAGWKKLGLATLWTLGFVTFTVSSLVFVLMPMMGVENHQFSKVIEKLSPYFVKETLELGRIVLGIIWFAWLYSLFRVFEHAIDRATAGILARLGAKSLYTYCIHSVVVFALAVLTPQSTEHPAISTLLALIVVAVIFLLVVSRSLEKLTRLSTYQRIVSRIIGYNRDYESVRTRG